MDVRHIVGDSSPFFDADRSDQYFLNTRKVLEGEGLDPTVTMEVFPNDSGLLCGLNEVLDHLAKILPSKTQIWALPEGCAMASKEVVLRITGAYRDFGLYETSILGTLSHESGWATAARNCVEASTGIPVISFGARHVHPAVSDRMEYAAMVGGCNGCATPAGARLAGAEATGTMPHALMLIFGDTLLAAEAFDRHMDDEARRVVLVDTFLGEAEESLRIANAMGSRLSGVRLDTPSELGGVTPGLVNEVRNRLDAGGHRNVMIFVSGGMNPDRIHSFVSAGCKVDGFGVGSAISGATPLDFTADIKELEGRPIAKRGRTPGISANPRLKLVNLSN
jgi:nicotinate phosphoribosyltransferase